MPHFGEVWKLRGAFFRRSLYTSFSSEVVPRAYFNVLLFFCVGTTNPANFLYKLLLISKTSEIQHASDNWLCLVHFVWLAKSSFLVTIATWFTPKREPKENTELNLLDNYQTDGQRTTGSVRINWSQTIVNEVERVK